MAATAPIDLYRTHSHTFMGVHVLDGLPGWHPCAKVHGITSVITLRLAGSSQALPENGMIGDVETLREFDEWAEATFSGLVGWGRTLNTVLGGPGDIQTLATWVWEQWHERIPELVQVSATEEAMHTTATWPDGTAT